MPLYLRPMQAACLLGMTTRGLRELERRGLLKPMYTPGGHRRYDAAALMKAFRTMFPHPFSVVAYGFVDMSDSELSDRLARLGLILVESVNDPSPLVPLPARSGFRRAVELVSRGAAHGLVIPATDSVGSRELQWLRLLEEKFGVHLHVLEELELQEVQNAQDENSS